MKNNNGEGGFGICDLHMKPVNEDIYRWKGCWGCWHFSCGKDFPYVDVKEAAVELKVSPSTVRRWLKKGKLSGEVFYQGRPAYGGNLKSPRKYHIKKGSISKLRRQKRRHDLDVSVMRYL